MNIIYKVSFILCLLVLLNIGCFAQVVINELSNSNGSGNRDEEGKLNDWIEFYNKGDNPVDLWNYTLTDDPDKLDKWTFPSVVLNPKSFLLVYCSGKDKIVDQGVLHANFKLSKEGEEIIFATNKGILADYLILKGLHLNHSKGRSPDGNNNWCFFNQPSPNFSNAQSFCFEGYEPDPVFSKEGGFYSKEQDLKIYARSPTAITRFTTDGSIPSGTAKSYSSAIYLSSSKVIAARNYSLKANLLPSRLVSNSYFIKEDEYIIGYYLYNDNKYIARDRYYGNKNKVVKFLTHIYYDHLYDNIIFG